MTRKKFNLPRTWTETIQGQQIETKYFDIEILKCSIPFEKQQKEIFLNPSLPGFKSKINNYWVINNNSNTKIQLFILIRKQTSKKQHFQKEQELVGVKLQPMLPLVVQQSL